MPKKVIFSVIMLIMLLGIALMGAEIISRVKFKDTIRSDERNSIYHYHQTLGWFPKKNFQSEYTGSVTTTIIHNNFGFRDKPVHKKTKPRIAFIGDSFVYGFDVEAHERFTDKLQAALPHYEIINLGVSGYGTDQEYLLTQELFHELEPDIVFLLVCYNDLQDISTNLRYGGYYKPFYIMVNDTLSLNGIPVPKSLNYYSKSYPLLYKSRFIQYITHLTKPPARSTDIKISTLVEELKGFVTSRGAQFIVGHVNHPSDQTLNLDKHLQQFNSIQLTNTKRFPSYGNHWTSEGHTLVKDTLLKHLITYGYVQ